jgi:hypothetical protein
MKQTTSFKSAETKLFYSSELEKEVDIEYREFKSRIKKQFVDSETTRNFVDSSKIGTQGMLIALVITFVLNLLMSGALGYMIMWINTL